MIMRVAAAERVLATYDEPCDSRVLRVAIEYRTRVFRHNRPQLEAGCMKGIGKHGLIIKRNFSGKTILRISDLQWASKPIRP